MEQAGWPTPPEAAAWYEVVSGDSIRQGDVYRDLAIVRLADDITREAIESEQVQVTVSNGTVIVLSPSCDLEQNRVETGVLVARVWPASEQMLGATKRSDYRKRLELLRQDGYAPRFLLPATDACAPPFPWSFVEWRQPYFLPKPYLQSLSSTPRLRLNHPFREKFGGWAGARLSEVGIEAAHTLKRFISIGGAGDVLEAREGHENIPTSAERDIEGIGGT